MIASEARAMLGLLLAVWPSPALPAETETAWLELLIPQRFEVCDFKLAIFSHNETPRAFRPHISEMISASIANWHLRLERESQPELGEGSGADLDEYLTAHPEDRARLQALADRAVPDRDAPLTREEVVTLGQLKGPKQRPISLGMCSGVGKETKVIDGVVCCPVCSSPISEGCRPQEAAHADR
jgi:hypothetical protein